MIELTGKRALVCGSTQGMGRASAIELARQGANVTLVARNAESLEAVCRDLDRSRGQEHATLCQDFSDPHALGEKVQTYVKETGPIHILLNNTSGPSGGPILAATPDEFIKAFTQHLICNQLLTQAVVPGMKSESYGRIINIISPSTGGVFISESADPGARCFKYDAGGCRELGEDDGRRVGTVWDHGEQSVAGVYRHGAHLRCHQRPGQADG